MKPLEGIKVVDLSRYLAGPYCGTLLGDMGAEVIKVEPVDGEYLRHVGPFYEGESLYYMVMNRNKRGITLNTRTEDAKDILWKLIESADILINNYTPGTLEKIGLSWEKIHEVNPKLILVSISGWGQTGPMANLPGYDSLAQAIGGLMSMTGPSDGEPYLAGSFLIDYSTGIYAAFGAVIALYTRRMTGVGQRVDTCLLDSALSLLVDGVPVEAVLDLRRKRMGNLDRNSAPVGNFLTKDEKYVLIVAGPDKFFESLMRIIGREELIEDARFNTASRRYEHVHDINSVVKEWASHHNRDEIVDVLRENGVPVAPVLETWETISLSQVEHNNMIINFPYKGLGDIPLAGFPVKLSETPAGVTRGAPATGEHNSAVLRELGFTEKDIEEFKNNGTI